MPFTHLHVHTEYSLLDGSSKIKELVKETKNLGMDAIAITDHGVMYGAIDFYKTCLDEGVKPIIGCECYVAPGSRHDKNAAEGSYYHLVLLAENKEGYHNLIKMVSAGFTEGFYYKPRIDMELLEQYHEGVIALSACLAGPVARRILRNSYDEAKEAALQLNQIFGQGNFYLELQDHGIEEQRRVNQELMRMSKETGIPLVATNDIHYTYKEDQQAHDILLCIQTNKKLQDEDRMRYEGGQFYLKSPEEMAELFPYAPEAITNTETIAKRCNVDFTFHELKLPKFDVPEGFTAEAYLRKLCWDGLARRYDPITEEQKLRLEYELSVIEQMGYVDYFLITWDFIRYGRDNGIMVGPGRGSAAGSLVSYCLQITDIDPLKYQLIFERFLNPERVSMPDIDIDFCYERRGEVIDYVVEKYGETHVAQIITFGTMAAKAVIRDVGRALNMMYGDVDRIAKMIPTALGMTIDKALKANAELQEAYDDNDEIRFLIDMSRRLEGLPRHSSTHAAGVVIAGKPIVEYVPLNSNDGAITTQFPMTTLEELGLLKMDFLGLRTLTVIQNAVDNIKHTCGLDIDMEKINWDDPKVYALIGDGNTDGVFQLESAGMKSFMRNLEPENLEDVIAGISLYRPGPMDFIPKYIKGKKNRDQISYTTKELQPILETTYGCIVYQEQVMQIVRDLAGYTWGRSDLVRRAMSKKKADVMARERQNFIYGNEEEGVKGCVANGISEDDANQIFDEMTDFAKYAFNKSHAAAYAIIAYQTAWLKTHYPVEFMAALLTSVMDNTDKVTEYMMHCKEMGIEIMAPDVNEGFAGFSVTEGKIRYGLAAIKNVGRNVIKALVATRTKDGSFTCLLDFCERMNKDINKRGIEGLIKAGAFDSLGGTRKQYMHVHKSVIDGVSYTKKNNIEGQLNLMGIFEEEAPKEELPDVGEYPIEALLQYEKEAIGIYLSGHPLSQYEESWQKYTTNKSIDFHFKEEGGVLHDGQDCVIGGILMDKSIKTTRNNKMMAFLTIEDMYGIVEVILFPNVYEKYKDNLIEDNKLYITGRITQQEEDNAKLICEEMWTFEEQEELEQASVVWLKVSNQQEWNRINKKVAASLCSSPGNTPIKIYIEQENIKFMAGEELWIQPTRKVIHLLRSLLGKSNVVIK